MTNASRRLAAATAILCVLSGVAAAAQLTNAVTLGVQAADNWTDLGAGPLTVSPVATFSQRQVFVAIADTQPAATAPGEPLFGPRHYEGTSHVWALATAGLSAQVIVTNESTGGAGGGASGAVTEADGANQALGSKADAAAASPSTTASLIATFRGYWSAWTTSAATAALQKVKPPPTVVTMAPSPDWTIPAGSSTAMNVANTNRKGLYVVNVGANPCRLNFGAAAAASTGILLPANGGGISQDAGIVTQQALFAYCSAASTISVTEAQ